MHTITSRQHPRIKEIAQLKHAKHRAAYQECIAEGIRTITTMCERMQPKEVYCTQAMLGHAQQITDMQRITLVNDEVMLKISNSAQPAGIAAIFAIPQEPTAPLTPGLVLAQVSDPGNMGTIIRMAAAMGITSIVVVEGTDPWGPKVVQSSAGTLAYTRIYQWDWQTLVARKGDLELIALVVDGGTSPESIALNTGLIVVGNEAQGIPNAWLADCTKRCTLAMPGKTESLNAAIATSIVLYIAYVQQTHSS